VWPTSLWRDGQSERRARIRRCVARGRANTGPLNASPAELPGRGRPALRTAAWRAVWGTLRANTVYATRFEHLTTRTANPLKAGQARGAIAAALLRQLFVVVTRRVAWNPAIAAGEEVTALAA
jgi:transposase